MAQDGSLPFLNFRNNDCKIISRQNLCSKNEKSVCTSGYFSDSVESRKFHLGYFRDLIPKIRSDLSD
jgi:hypothetical protein